jgi:hypothetical protein
MRAESGHNPEMTTNYERVSEDRPEVLGAWAELNGSIKAVELEPGLRGVLVVGRPIDVP